MLGWLCGQPWCRALHDKYADRGLTVVGISLHEKDVEAPARYFKEKHYSYLGLVQGEAAGRAYGVGPIPHIFVIGPDGIVADQIVGSGPKLAERIEKKVLELLPATRN